MLSPSAEKEGLPLSSSPSSALNVALPDAVIRLTVTFPFAVMFRAREPMAFAWASKRTPFALPLSAAIQSAGETGLDGAGAVEVSICVYAPWPAVAAIAAQAATRIIFAFIA